MSIDVTIAVRICPWPFSPSLALCFLGWGEANRQMEGKAGSAGGGGVNFPLQHDVFISVYVR